MIKLLCREYEIICKNRESFHNVNDDYFCRVSGFHQGELKKKPHIVR